jgi:phage terminase large subunit
MENQGVPEAWVREEVVLHTVSDREFLATLVEIKDFGFAYRFSDDEDIIFSPWTVLRWMRLASEGDDSTGASPYSHNTATSMAS